MANLSISELTQQISDTLKSNFSKSIDVEGEISNFSVSTNGHWYFTLKDDKSQINAVMFKGNNLKIPTPNNGDNVQVLAKVSFYKDRGACQIICEFMSPLGMGTLLAELEARKQKLSKEGLFDLDRKKHLPLLPQKIALITSLNAAALQDIQKIFIERSLPIELFIFPCMVQGLSSGKDIADKISQAVLFSSHNTKLDALIISRGGGSMEDLISFSDEIVVRAIAKSPIPVVSGIGHETDIALADFAADIHQPTPTAAAVYICDKFQSTKDNILYMHDEILSKADEKVLDIARKIDSLSPTTLTNSILDKIYSLRQTIDNMTDRLQTQALFEFSDAKQKLLQYTEMITAASPEHILKKGYVLVKDIATSQIIPNHTLATSGKNIALVFHDGTKHAIIK